MAVKNGWSKYLLSARGSGAGQVKSVVRLKLLASRLLISD